MDQYILNTDHLTLFQNNHPVVIQKVQSNIQNIKITIITAEEQLRGRFNIIRRNSQSNKTEQLIIAYINLRQTIEFFSSLELLDFSRDAYNIYSELSCPHLVLRLSTSKALILYFGDREDT